jgi:beta-glucosidase
MYMAAKKYYLLFVASFLFAVFVCAQTVPPYKDAKLPVAARVKDLLQRMTPEEKFWQLFMIPGDLGNNESKYKNGIFGFQVSAASKQTDAASQLLQYGTTENAFTLAQKINSIQKYFVEQTRLGIPIIAFDEALHGLVRNGATSFPQAIGLAASWDTGLLHRVANAIAVETKSRGIRQVLGPVVNIAGDPRWGRTEETYGEDPFLSSAMAVAYVSAFEKMGIITTPKHFVANVGEGGRDSYPIHFNERLLDEIYFPPFKAAITSGGAGSIMTAYNSVDGSPASANDWLLNKKLKNDWQFKGFVISDASAVGGANVLHNTAKDYPDAAKKSITNGLDVIFQTAYEHYKLFIPPFLNGQISAKRIDDAVARVLTAKFELGLFEHPYISEETAKEWTANQSHKALAKEAAVKSIVLLKNEKQVLPLDKNIRSITVIGPDAVEARLGGYSGPGNGKINILDGIKEKLGSTANVIYSEGVGRKNSLWQTIPADYLSVVQDGKTIPGLKADYYHGLIPGDKPAVTRTDAQIDFNWTLYPPDSSLSADNYSVRWTGQLRSPGTGSFKIGLDGNDGYRLYVNNTLLIDNWRKQTYSTRLVDYAFEKDKLYNIRVEFYEPAGNAHIRLIWNAGVVNNDAQKIKEAVEAAQKSDVTIVVAGIEEGEFRDRAMLGLPGSQETLIQTVAATGKPLIVLLVGGSAITMNNWIDKVSAVVTLWYPGEEGGQAVADILFGEANPAGRLPITFPLSEAQLPLVYNHKPTGRGDDYNNLSGLPLFPFGFGLSYTQFGYSNIRLEKKEIHANESVKVHCTITNTGKREGDEVAQLYIRDMLSSVAQPVLQLKGFRRIHLAAGESKQIDFTITPGMLQVLNDKMQTVLEPGDFRIMIGSSSHELWLKEDLRVK